MIIKEQMIPLKLYKHNTQIVQCVLLEKSNYLVLKKTLTNIDILVTNKF